jgi:hypothetical protein
VNVGVAAEELSMNVCWPVNDYQNRAALPVGLLVLSLPVALMVEGSSRVARSRSARSES